MIIGSHVHFRNEQLMGSVKEALSYGANTFMIYTGAPQNTLRSSINEEYTKEAYKLMQENNMDIKHVICHAPYIINLANKNDLSKWQFSITFLKGEITRCKMLGIKNLVIHPGSAVNIEKNEGLKNIAEALNYAMDNIEDVMILLETMSGKGSECGSNLTEIKYIIDNVNNKKNIGVCIDSCHLNDSGYNLAEFDNFLNEFDKIIGLKHLKCLHLNDSKNIMGAHKDRHENIGFGTLSFATILNIIYHEKLKEVPIILETPYVDDEKNSYPPYKFEIEMLKSKIFNENLKQNIIDYYRK